MTNEERFAKQRHAVGLLFAFVVGWQLAPQVAATNSHWYRLITSILTVLPYLVLLFLALSFVGGLPTKNPQKPAPKSRQDDL